MKQNGKIGLVARMLALVAGVFATKHDSRYDAGDGNRAQGRDAFYGVSAGRQHNVKNRHPL
jgi:hypothetical protein